MFSRIRLHISQKKRIFAQQNFIQPNDEERILPDDGGSGPLPGDADERIGIILAGMHRPVDSVKKPRSRWPHMKK